MRWPWRRHRIRQVHDVTVVLRVDTSGFERAMQHAAESARRIASFGISVREWQRRHRRERHGWPRFADRVPQR